MEPEPRLDAYAVMLTEHGEPVAVLLPYAHYCLIADILDEVIAAQPSPVDTTLFTAMRAEMMAAEAPGL